MITKSLKILVAAMMLISSFAKADDIYLGEPVYNGTGCAPGSVESLLSFDFKTLSILMREFVAHAGRGSPTGTQVDIKNCTLAIPVHVPQGFSVSVIGVDYRGVVSVPSGGMARFSAEYMLAPQQGRGVRLSKLFTGPTNIDYLVEHDLTLSAAIWSPCGKDVNLRINASMLARQNFRGDDTLATVDSVDISAGMIYSLQWKRCY